MSEEISDGEEILREKGLSADDAEELKGRVREGLKGKYLESLD